MEDNLTISLSLEQDAIKGFSYSFASSLLRKLKELHDADRIFEDGKKHATSNNQRYGRTSIAEAVISYLSEQVGYFKQPENAPDVDALISHAEEFLATFKPRTRIQELVDNKKKLHPELKISDELKRFLLSETKVLDPDTRLYNMFGAARIKYVYDVILVGYERLKTRYSLGAKTKVMLQKKMLDNDISDERFERLHEIFTEFHELLEGIHPHEIGGLINTQNYQDLIEFVKDKENITDYRMPKLITFLDSLLEQGSKTKYGDKLPQLKYYGVSHWVRSIKSFIEQYRENQFELFIESL